MARLHARCRGGWMIVQARRAALVWLLLAGSAGALPDASTAPDTPEPGSIEAIKADTTDPKFGNPWVSYVPASSTVTSPTKYLGHIVGKSGELSRTDKIFGYFRELARTSPRVHVETIGKSEEGREILLVAVA